LAPAVGTEKFAYVAKLVVTPDTLSVEFRQPTTKDVEPAGHVTALPIEFSPLPAAVHCATVTSVHADEPVTDVVPAGHGYCVAALVPGGQ
jgi:hypothetical protein